MALQRGIDPTQMPLGPMRSPVAPYGNEYGLASGQAGASAQETGNLSTGFIEGAPSTPTQNQYSLEMVLILDSSGPI